MFTPGAEDSGVQERPAIDSGQPKFTTLVAIRDMQKLTKGQVALLAAVYVALLIAWAYQISGSVIRDNALGTLTPAVNLVHDGVYSFESEPPLAPTMYREPVPIAIATLAVQVVDAVMGPAPLD